jgi:hypothetical protein
MNEIDKRAARLKLAVEGRFAEWREDPAVFSKLYPDIRMEVVRGEQPAVNALRSIAKDVMMGSRFDWKILEVFGGDPIFSIGLYDPERPER